MKAGRIKLTTPEAFMNAFSRYESIVNDDEDKSTVKTNPPINSLFDDQ